MEFDLSAFGRKLGGPSGIGQLMEDLGRAMAEGHRRERPIRMLGGGNPAQIPAVQATLRRATERILAEPGRFERMIGNYDPPQGNPAFIAALAELLRKEFGWAVGPENIALTNGSQSAFFALFNMFAGEYGGGRRRRILLPLAPEYIGYADVGLSDDFFVAARPEIEHREGRLFKYHVDFDRLEIDESVGAICVSRPTNPTGNVLTDGEIEGLMTLARRHRIPLLIDSAYGTPFPNIIFTEARPFWDEGVIVCMSLSKLGLPAARTGIVIANREVIAALSQYNAIKGLAPTGLGPALALDLVASGEILTLSREVIRPFYESRVHQALGWLHEALAGLDYHIHVPEGALFLWLWVPGLPGGSQRFYERLKDAGTLVIAGQHFFPGIDASSSPWPHTQECIRITYSQAEADVRAGIEQIGTTLREILEHPAR